METEKKGRITQVVGAVLDIRFPDGDLPKIYEAIHIPAGEQGVLTVEVAQHLGDDTVRCIAMDVKTVYMRPSWVLTQLTFFWKAKQTALLHTRTVSM